jgi:hypothetical protein
VIVRVLRSKANLEMASVPGVALKRNSNGLLVSVVVLGVSVVT